MADIRACIFLLSSRTQCLKACLESCIKYLGDIYPIYVYHFDNIYTHEFIKDIHDTISKKIYFIQVPYKIPNHIHASELFYNRSYLHYVSSGQFTKRRLGYLHMCYFSSNFWNYQNTKFGEYDYVMQIDDDAGFEAPVDLVNIFRRLKQNNLEFGSINVTQPRKYGTHQGCIDTRQNLCQFVKDYCRTNNIIPKQEWLRKMVEYDFGDNYFHNNLINCDSNVYKLSLFERPEVKHFVEKVNEYGGQYKYRWGDNEITTLIHELFIEADVLDFKLVQKRAYNPGLFGCIQRKAPSVLNTQ